MFGRWNDKHSPSRSRAANMAEFTLLPEKNIGGNGRCSGRGQIAISGNLKNSPSHANGSDSARDLRISLAASWARPCVTDPSVGSYVLNSAGVPRSGKKTTRP